MLITRIWTILVARNWGDLPEVVSWEVLRQQWRLKGSDLIPIESVIVVVTFLTTAFVMMILWRRRNVEKPKHAPMQLLSQVVEGFGLTPADLRLLVRVARQQELHSPITLLLSPATFDHHVRQHIESDNTRVGQRARSQLDRIRQVLFLPKPTGASKR